MLTTVYVLIVMGLTPEGAIHVEDGGRYSSLDACNVAITQLQEILKEEDLPLERFAVKCLESPWEANGSEVQL